MQGKTDNNFGKQNSFHTENSLSGSILIIWAHCCFDINNNWQPKQKDENKLQLSIVETQITPNGEKTRFLIGF